MEELGLAAKAYFNNSSRDHQHLATNFFRSMDTNGDERVSDSEFTRFLQQNGYHWVNSDMFAQLDANGDGSLDFWEVLTFYYIVKTRAVWCDGCGVQLHALYFTCVACFDDGSNTYDLCAQCYSGRNFRHSHEHFLDSYVLLRSKRGLTPCTNVNLAITQPQSNKLSLNHWFRAMELAINVGGLVGCSIM
ncbi:Parvalbumin [Trema orientale]|uniref:Parvalbumin n=1 Tax=Trema orientale TaxID=63057 RepID=A0A2P5FAP2_TREOI|nr:Parvalbumin [Trema orientale]